MITEGQRHSARAALNAAVTGRRNAGATWITTSDAAYLLDGSRVVALVALTEDRSGYAVRLRPAHVRRSGEELVWLVAATTTSPRTALLHAEGYTAAVGLAA